MRDVPSQQQELADVFADYTCVAHFDGKELVLESVSEGFTRITGYTLDEFNARGGAGVAIHPDDVMIALQSLERLMTGESDSNEIRAVMKSGDVRWLRYLARPERDEAAPQVLRLYGAVQDITESKAAGQQVQESERRFRQLAENIQEVFWLTDPLRSQILYCSPAYEDIWGRSRESLYEQPWTLWESVSPEDRDQVIASLEKQQRGEPTDLEHRIVRPDGSVRWVRERCFPIKAPSGQVYRVAGIADDITERKRLEQQFHQAQKMEAVGRLAGGMAHELNNILHVILGYSSLLLGSVPKEQPIYEALCEIKNQGERATRLTEQLQAFARRQMLAPVLMNLNDLVTDVEKVLRLLLGESIHLFTRLNLGLQPIKVDPIQIREALVNLALNAKDAMPHGGEFTIQTANADPEDETFRAHPEARAGAYVMLVLSDTGRGMDEETQKRCLEPFFTTKEFGKGSGLGLSTVDGIVHQSGGFLTLSSELGKGTAFTIYLPAVEQADPS